MCSMSCCQSLCRDFLTPSPKSSPALSPGPSQQVGLDCHEQSISTEVKMETGPVHHLSCCPLSKVHGVCPGRSFLHSDQKGLVCPLGTGAVGECPPPHPPLATLLVMASAQKWEMRQLFVPAHSWDIMVSHDPLQKQTWHLTAPLGR